MDVERMACRGGDTIQVYKPGTEFRKCVECETAIRWDLCDHPLLGFQGCEHANSDDTTGAASEGG